MASRMFYPAQRPRDEAYLQLVGERGSLISRGSAPPSAHADTGQPLRHTDVLRPEYPF